MRNVTPLSFACFVENCAIIRIFIDHNANISSPIHIYYSNIDACSECEILTPLCVSVLQNNLDVLKLLVDNVLDTVTVDVNYIMIGLKFFENISMAEEQCLNLGRIRLTSFQVAFVLQNITIASFLITVNYADINRTFVITPMFLSLYFECHAVLARIVSKQGIKIKMFETELTPLVFSALVGNVNLMTLLLENHANSESNVSLSLLHVIVLHKDILNTFDRNEKYADFKLECTVDSLLICCLKDNVDMSNALLKTC